VSGKPVVRAEEKPAACLRCIWSLRPICGVLLAVLVCILAEADLNGQEPKLTIHWDKTTVVSKTTPTLQVVVNPPLLLENPLSAASYKALKDLGADYVRYVLWLSYPRLARSAEPQVVRH
jgi:hypothetical protein